MRRDIDSVEIVEPPIGELTKKYSAFSAIKRACLTGCGCLVFLIIGIIIFLRIALGNGPEILTSVPANFPSNIPVYDPDSIEQITFVSGKYKNRGVEIAAFFPKLILSPLLMKSDNKTADKSEEGAFSSVSNLWKTITTPISDHRDTVQIEWRDLTAGLSFINSYYRTELQKQGYTIDVQSTGDDVQQFSFSQNLITGSLYIKGSAGKNAEYAILTVNLDPTTPTDSPK